MDKLRYYLLYSSIFDNPENKYDVNLFKRTIKSAGGSNIRTSYAYGWSNQPKVVTFDATDDQLSKIEGALNKVLPFNNCSFGCLVYVKDW